MHTQVMLIERGWFMAKEEGAEGVMALGIAGRVSDRLAALSVVGPTQRLERNLEACVQVLQEERAEFF